MTSLFWIFCLRIIILLTQWLKPEECLFSFLWYCSSQLSNPPCALQPFKNHFITHPKLTVSKLVQASVILYTNYGQVSCLGNLCLTSSCSTSYKHMLKSPLFTSKGLGHMAFPVFCSYCRKLIQNKELCIPSSGASSKSWKNESWMSKRDS